MHGQHACLDCQGDAVLCSRLDGSHMQTRQKAHASWWRWPHDEESSSMQVWRYDQKSADWQQDGVTLVGHTDWVRDVAWAPNLGLPKTVIASAGQDGKVLIWTESRDVPGQWSPALLHDFKVQLHISQELFAHVQPRCGIRQTLQARSLWQ